ncbi:MAG: AbrB/MazE/SpoVT family DNA-binding domain-containing protein [bacterium]
MLTKKTSKNQVTIPRALLDELPETDYFDASIRDGAILLRPVRVTPAADIEVVRDRLASEGIEPDEVEQAIKWARRRK